MITAYSFEEGFSRLYANSKRVCYTGPPFFRWVIVACIPITLARIAIFDCDPVLLWNGPYYTQHTSPHSRAKRKFIICSPFSKAENRRLAL